MNYLTARCQELSNVVRRGISEKPNLGVGCVQKHTTGAKGKVDRFVVTTLAFLIPCGDRHSMNFLKAGIKAGLGEPILVL